MGTSSQFTLRRPFRPWGVGFGEAISRALDPVDGSAMRISVIAATRHGSTLEVASPSQDRLTITWPSRAAWKTTCKMTEPEGDAVVLGSPLYMGRWLKPAREIAERLCRDEEQRPIFVFTCGPLGDPPKPAPPAPDELFPALAAKARELRVFAGRLDLGALNRRERLVVRAVDAEAGDFRDFKAIEGFADEIATTLEEPVPLS